MDIRVVQEGSFEPRWKVSVQTSTGRRVEVVTVFEEGPEPLWVEIRDIGIAIAQYASMKMPRPAPISPAPAASEDEASDTLAEETEE